MLTPFQPPDAARFNAALRRFDEENARDPNMEVVDGSPQPRELVHARWLTDWVLRLRPDASEALRLAARSQHICRWTIPRNAYPMTKPGYLQWRAALKRFHAQKAGEILAELGYPSELIQRVQDLNLKKNLASDPECQTLEDALCLVFLEHQLTDLAAKTDDDKMINALQKSWNKMSEAGRAAALKFNYSPKELSLIQHALKPAT